MPNPYQPPSSRTETPLKEDVRRGTYAGGFWAVAGLALVAGVVIGILLLRPETVSPVYPFGVPFIVLFAAFVTLTLMLRGVPMSWGARLLTALGLTLPAYILFVPVCTVSSMFTTPLVGSEQYGPKPAGVVIGSAVAALLILLSFAALLRLNYRSLQSPKDTPSGTDASGESQSTPTERIDAAQRARPKSDKGIPE